MINREIKVCLEACDSITFTHIFRVKFMGNLEVELVGAYLKCFSTLHFKIICISLVHMATKRCKQRLNYILRRIMKGSSNPKPKPKPNPSFKNDPPIRSTTECSRIECISIKCRKTKTKVITRANQKEGKCP